MGGTGGWWCKGNAQGVQAAGQEGCRGEVQSEMPVGDSSEGWGWEDAWGDAGGRGGEDAGRMFSGQCPGVVRGGWMTAQRCAGATRGCMRSWLRLCRGDAGLCPGWEGCPRGCEGTKDHAGGLRGANPEGSAGPCSGLRGECPGSSSGASREGVGGAGRGCREIQGVVRRHAGVGAECGRVQGTRTSCPGSCAEAGRGGCRGVPGGSGEQHRARRGRLEGS